MKTMKNLVAEVKEIYAGLTMVEARCIDIDDTQSGASKREPGSRSEGKVGRATSTALPFISMGAPQETDLEMGYTDRYFGNVAGFPRLSTLFNRDDEPMIIRRFGFLHRQLLLDQTVSWQRYVQDLEAKLDFDDSVAMARTHRSVRIPDALPQNPITLNQDRRSLLDEIGEKLHEHRKSMRTED